MSHTLDPLPPTYAPPAAAAADVALTLPAPAASPDAPPPPTAAAEPGVDGAGATGGASAAQVPRDTTPTWELELLVSGAVLFGLFQLAGALDGCIAAREPHTGLIGTFVVLGGGLLGLTALYTLIVCFVVHLALRAYWVALVGVQSVFPGGPRWERLRQHGPIQTSLLRARVRPLPEFIGRVDNAASIVFAGGFVFAVSGIAGALLLAPAGVLLWALERALGLDRALVALVVLFLPVLLFQIGAGLLDYQFKERIDPAGRLGRLVRVGLRLAIVTSPASVRSLSTVLTSNVAPRVVTAAVMVSGALFGAVAFTRVTDDRVLPGRNNYPLFVDAGPGALAAEHYASMHAGDGASRRAPWIDSDVVTGPYLRLHIPYRPLVHERALAAACPEVRPLEDEDGGEPATPAARAAAEAVLRCAARVHRIALDGRPLEGVRLRFLADARTNRRTFVAHVPVAALAPGEHRLTVWPVRRPDGDMAVPLTPYEIPFWR